MPDTSIDRVLVAGATGRTGRHVAAAARARGLTPVALARDAGRARDALPDVEIAVGDLEDAGSLVDPVRDIDAIIFVHGSDADSRQDSVQRIDYGGVLNTLQALGERTSRIVLQTTLFVTRRDNSLNRAHTRSTGSVDRSASSDSAARPTPSCGRDGSTTTPLAPTSPSSRVTPATAASPGRSSPTSTSRHSCTRPRSARLSRSSRNPERPPATGTAYSGRRGPTPAEPSTPSTMQPTCRSRTSRAEFRTTCPDYEGADVGGRPWPNSDRAGRWRRPGVNSGKLGAFRCLTWGARQDLNLHRVAEPGPKPT